MKVLAIVGTQLRHRFFLRTLAASHSLAGVLFFERTIAQPTKCSESESPSDILSFEAKHFEQLRLSEEKFFQKAVETTPPLECPTMMVSSKAELNGTKTIEWVESLEADVMIDYGSMILSKEFLNVLPEWKINLHGGLSPFYRGSATLLWPFYFQQPELAGVTFHQLTPKIDGGAILQHHRPTMLPGDSPTDIGARAIYEASSVGSRLLDRLKQKGTLETFTQKSSGKLFLEKDYKPSHLPIVYQLFKSGMIERYLQNKEQIDSRYHFVNQL